jgi:hypothetical protein
MREPQLTAEELSLLQRKDLLPSKHRLLAKLDQQLATLATELTDLQEAAGLGKHPLLRVSGKVSRGENYHLQSYRVLDYPRVFDKKDIFAFRSMVLWGHEISFHLLLSGIYLQQFGAKVRAAAPQLSGYYLARHDTPWTWEQESPGWLPCEALRPEDWERLLSERTFLKLSCFLPLENIAELVPHGKKVWRKWLDILALSTD